MKHILKMTSVIALTCEEKQELLLGPVFVRRKALIKLTVRLRKWKRQRLKHGSLKNSAVWQKSITKFTVCKTEIPFDNEWQVPRYDRKLRRCVGA